MSISFKKYVDITSGVAGSGAVRARELILRLFTTNPLVPTKTVVEFTSVADVGTYFGTTSTEYKRASSYFNFISKVIQAPQKISFYFWNQAASPARVYSAPDAVVALAAFTAISNGRLALTLGATTATLTAIDLSGAASLAAVAALIQTAVRTNVDVNWATATVTYDATRGSFNLTGGVAAPTSEVPVTVNATTGADLGVKLGWEDPLTILSNGQAITTLTTTMDDTVDISTNFGSFCFVPTLVQADFLELAQWQAVENVDYMALFAIPAATAAAISAAIIAYPGCAMTLAPLSTEYPEQFPGSILAATDYNSRNASQNYMFYQGIFTASVTTDANSDAYDLLRVNYFGETQTAGQKISFYQRGILTGGATAPVDMNVYANEMWLKDNAGDAFLSLLLALPQVSNNLQGKAQLCTTLQSVIDKALFNSTISVGKILTNSQKLTIGSLTGDPNAWYQVQTIGYWFDIRFEAVVTQDSRTEYQAVYTLVYSKNDAIRKVVGTHDLI